MSDFGDLDRPFLERRHRTFARGIDQHASEVCERVLAREVLHG